MTPLAAAVVAAATPVAGADAADAHALLEAGGDGESGGGETKQLCRPGSAFLKHSDLPHCKPKSVYEIPGQSITKPKCF